MKSAIPLCGLLLALVSATARADLVREINKARVQGCGGHAGISLPLRANRKLGEAAQRLHRGENLRDAMAAAGYHGVKSTSIHMTGWLTDSSVARTFSNRFCQSLGDADLREMGFYRSGREMWFVLAQPFSSLPLGDLRAISQRVLELVNEARSHARRCGRETFAAAPPLQISPLLERAALEHSRDMAAHDYFEHEGRDGSAPAERVTRQGYKWRVTGENLAAGVTTANEAVSGWLASPHHCANLMDPRFTETGIAYAVKPASQLGIYWTQVFALPQPRK